MQIPGLFRFFVPMIVATHILVDHAEPNESKAALGLTTPQMAEQILNAFFSKQPSVVS